MRKFCSRRPRSFRHETLEPRCLLAADVFINEFMASNDQLVLDEDGDDSDWIEILNIGPDDINLQGWYLTDDDAELDKWAFPDQPLPAGNLLLVYASDKDRAVGGEPLHTNFRLSAGGEYLALSQDVEGAIQVVSEFAPDFPEQVTNVSYGVTQSVETNVIVIADDGGRLLIPDSTPDASWTTVDFDDSAWDDSTAAIGYQTTVPGLTVEDAKASSSIENLSTADAVLAGQGQVGRVVTVSPVVNFFDSAGGGGVGRFGGDMDFPADTPADDNDFAVRATGTITIPTTGEWTFGTNSDDGVRLRIDGVDVIEDDTLHAPLDFFGTQNLTAGPHTIELTFFERGGGAEVELFAAEGSFANWDPSFRLVGDVGGGGLVVETSPSGGETGLGTLFTTDVGEAMFQSTSSAYLRIPFSVEDAASIESLTLQMHYDDGFVAYINGVEVARRNAPDLLDFDATATEDRSVFQSGLVENINVSQAVNLLNQGSSNVLAILGLNESADADEFLLRAELAEINVSNGDLAYFPTPTPVQFNPATGVADFLLTDVSFSHPHGFQEEAFELTIDATEGTTVRYTTDGSEPTDTNGIEYGGPISIDQTTTIRARSFTPDAEPSFVETSTFLFVEDILQQSANGQAPVGWPTSSVISGQQLDYGMDPQIVNSPTWGPQLAAALTQIPSMSIVMDVNDLLSSSSGIYTHANSHGRAWERPMSLELINPDATEGFQVNGGIRIRGGFSRTGNNPKHAFRLFFRDEYGDSQLEYPLFGDDGASDFKKIDLRTTQNYSWAFQGDGRNNFLRDIFSRDVQGLMGQPYTRGDYLHLYINGQYWGVYQTQERSEANFAASYFGGDDNDYDVVKSAGSSGGYENEATDGTLVAYQRLSEFFYQTGGLSDNNIEDYWRAQGMNADGTRNADYERLLDVDNLIDYMIITYFTSDADGPGSSFTRPRINNYFGIYNRENPDGFKFFEHDSEHSLDTGNAAGANYNMVTPLTTGGSQFRYFNPHWMHERLAEANSVYRERFADRVYETMFHDGPLAVANAQTLIDSRAAEIDVAMIAESARWGDAQRNTPYTLTDWQNAVATTRNWVGNRHSDVIGQLRSQGWYPDLDPPEFTLNGDQQHGGEVTVSDRIGFIESGSLVFDTLLPRQSVWSYLDDGSDAGTAWRAVDFDDSDWASGAGELGYGDGNEATEVSFGPNANNKYITTYFRTEFSIENDPSLFEAGRIGLRRDDGAIVYLNSQEVVRFNLSAGDVGPQTTALTFVGGNDESTYFDYDFDPSVLVEGTNVIAVEIHESSESSSDISFDLELLLGSSEPIGGSGVFYTLDGSDPQMADGTINPHAQEYGNAGFTLANSATISTRVFRNNQWSVLNAAEFRLVASGLPGDLDGDGDVDTNDVTVLVQNWTGALMPGEGNKTAAQGDIDGDGDVDTNDRTLMVLNWTGAGMAASRNRPNSPLPERVSPAIAIDEADAVDTLFEEDAVIDEVVLAVPARGFFLA